MGSYSLSPLGEGAQNLIELLDTPADRIGEAGRLLAVSDDENEFEYFTVDETTPDVVGDDVATSEVNAIPTVTNLGIDLKTITSLELCLDARLITGVSPGAEFAPWIDFGPQTRSAIQIGPDATRPRFVPSSFGSAPGVKFEGVQDELASGIAADWRFLNDGRSFSIYIVIKNAVSPPATSVIFDTGAVNLGDIGIRVTYNPDQSIGLAIQNGTLLVYNAKTPANSILPSTTPILIAITHDFRRRRNDLRFYINGGHVAGFDPVGTFAQADPTFPLNIGRDNRDALGGFLNATIGQIAIFSRGHSAKIRQPISDSLALVFGITGPFLNPGQVNIAPSTVKTTNIASAACGVEASPGVVDAFVVTLDPVPTSLELCQTIDLIPQNANTGACTVDPNGLGPVSIKLIDGSDPAANDILASPAIAKLQKQGTNYQLLNPASAGGAGASEFTEKTLTTNDAVETTIETIPLDDDTVYVLEIEAVARRTDGADRMMAKRIAGLFREAAGGATLQGSVATPYTEGNTNYKVTVDVSGNDARIRVTGSGTDVINWKIVRKLSITRVG